MWAVNYFWAINSLALPLKYVCLEIYFVVDWTRVQRYEKLYHYVLGRLKGIVSLSHAHLQDYTLKE